MQTFNFDVQGMTCGGCTGSVQRVISKLDGVSAVEVTLNTGAATVQADPTRVTEAQIQTTLVKLGFKAQIRPSVSVAGEV